MLSYLSLVVVDRALYRGAERLFNRIAFETAEFSLDLRYCPSYKFAIHQPFVGLYRPHTTTTSKLSFSSRNKLAELIMRQKLKLLNLVLFCSVFLVLLWGHGKKETGREERIPRFLAVSSNMTEARRGSLCIRLHSWHAIQRDHCCTRALSSIATTYLSRNSSSDIIRRYSYYL